MYFVLRIYLHTCRINHSLHSGMFLNFLTVNLNCKVFGNKLYEARLPN
jgi:hypothetical protein